MNPDAPREWSADVSLHDHPLAISFARPPDAVAPDRPLLLFATGDGGWRGLDKDVFRHLAAWSYPVAGFNASSYLKHLGSGSSTTTAFDLARDYGRLIAFADGQLQLAPGTLTVLVGVSRGAGLAVVAGGQSDLQPGLDGVLAVALVKEEEHVRRPWWRRLAARDRAGQHEPEFVQNYDYLEQLSSLPVAVIQSTHDRYLPAGQARELFGPDTPLRRFVAVAARSHTFAGGREALYRQIKASLAWITGHAHRRP